MAEEVYLNQSSRAFTIKRRRLHSGRSHSDEWYRDTPTNSDRIRRSTIWYTSVSSGYASTTSRWESGNISRTRSSERFWIWPNARLPVDRVHQTVRMTRREMIAFPPSGVSVKRVKDTFRSGNFMVTKGDAPDLITLRSKIRVRRWSWRLWRIACSSKDV
jgi:hypothetical protein